MSRLALVRVTALAGLAVFAGLAGCAQPESGVPAPAGEPDVWLVTVDTFRADRAGCMGHPGGLTPTIDRLARDGLLARDAFAPAPLTAASHASMLTGFEPPTHGVRENGAFVLGEMPTLATVLAEAGFRTGAAIAAFPLQSRFGFARGFDVFDEDLETAGLSMADYAERPAAAVVDVALDWVRTIPNPERYFLWTHFFDPHHPRSVVPALAKLPAPSDYEREIRGMDAEIARLARALAETGGRAPITAILSDHGEGLGDHGEASHGVLIHEETMRGVFALDAPRGTDPGNRLPRGLIREVVRFSDLLPTLADVLSIAVPDDLDGRSLLELPIGSDSGSGPAETSPEAGAYGETYYPMIHYGWSPLLSWRTARWSYLEGPEPELYDRTRDPGETVNVIGDHPAIAADLAARIARWARDPDPSETTTVDAETRDKLAALGYVSGGTDWAVDRSKNPKKLIGAANALFRGITLTSQGNARAALPFLQSAYRQDPDNASTLFYLANAFRLVGDFSTAMSYYRRAIEANPRAGEAFAHLAILEFERGRIETAFRILGEGLAVNPRSFPLLMSAGDLHRDVAQPDKAEALYREASLAEPDRPEAWARLAALAEEAGESSLARELWRKAIAIDPANEVIPERIREELGP